MSEIKIFQGNQIGGCVTVISTDYKGEVHRIMIDYGSSLPGSSREEDFQYPWNDEPVDAVFFTHYPEIKDFASKNENIVNARMTFDKETLMPTYRMVIGEAGKSCAFYIADRLGMPGYMLETAAKAAYGEDAAISCSFGKGQELKKSSVPKITKVKKERVNPKLNTLYNIGDSVMVFPVQKQRHFHPGMQDACSRSI